VAGAHQSVSSEVKNSPASKCLFRDATDRFLPQTRADVRGVGMARSLPQN
jgi:hypothetical protein